MTIKRMIYLKSIPVHERYYRSELEEYRKKIKMYKLDLCNRSLIIKERPELAEDKNYMHLLNIAKNFLKMHKAIYTSIKKLLPNRKPRKIKGPYWKVKQAGPALFLAKCSECGARIHPGKIADVEQQYKTCRVCGAYTDGRWKYERGKKPWMITN